MQQDFKNIKNVKKYTNKVGIMHESQGQHICKAPTLHRIHTAVRQCMGVFLKRTTSLLQWVFMAVASFSGHFLAPPTWPGNEEYDPAFVSVLL